MDKVDIEIINSFLSGDEESFDLLVKRWEKPLYIFIYRYTKNREDTLEILQETFASVYKNLKNLRNKNLFSAWIYKIALNYCRMFSRREKVSERSDPLEDNEGNVRKERDYFGKSESALRPDEILEREEIEKVINRALDRLPYLQREVIILKEFSGLKFVEIAKILGIPVSTAKSRMYLGLKNLKREVEKILKFEGNILKGSEKNEK